MLGEIAQLGHIVQHRLKLIVGNLAFKRRNERTRLVGGVAAETG